MRQHSHCSYCGAPYADCAPWPRRCASCGETTWRNPLPVAVALVPVRTSGGEDGLVVVRRSIDPGRGELGLPGGFIEFGESWRAATVRELWEETRIVAEPEQIRLFDVHSTPATHNVLIFGVLPERSAADLPRVQPTDETSEWLVVTVRRELAFSTHTQAMADYFAAHIPGCSR